MRGPGLEGLSTVALAIAAVIVAVSATDRLTRDSPSASSGPPTPQPIFIPDWEDGLPPSTLVAGPGQASVVVLTLVDFQCPVCRGWHNAALELVSAYGDLQLRYIHYPLSYHPAALSASNAAECAREQEGQPGFASLVDAFFEDQESLGERTWSNYAALAELTDTLSIAECAMSAEEHPRVTAGREFGAKVEAEGTPTVIVNGWLFHGMPAPESLTELLDSLTAADPPEVSTGN